MSVCENRGYARGGTERGAGSGVVMPAGSVCAGIDRVQSCLPVAEIVRDTVIPR